MDCHRIYARIDLDAIRQNISLVRSRIPANTRLMLVVKADAYGHGAAVLAKETEAEADYFAVAAIDEALELREAGITKPILVLGCTSPQLFGVALEHDITLTIFSAERAKILSNTAKSLGKPARVHFAVDTGMGRIGWNVSEESADEAAAVARMPLIEIEGIFSHFARADEADKTASLVQKEQFDRFLSMLEARGVSVPLRHLDNSAAILEFSEKYDMVRAGIILYGLFPSDEVTKTLPLKPALELISYISHVKTVPQGMGISYGATFVTPRPMRIATVPVGYADGYPRSLSGKGAVLIHGHRCPILGRICMDQMMVDVSDVPEAEIEDRVTLIGADGNERISVEEIAALAGTIHYEIICGLSRRVPRIYIRNGSPEKRVSYLEK